MAQGVTRDREPADSETAVPESIQTPAATGAPVQGASQAVALEEKPAVSSVDKTSIKPGDWYQIVAELDISGMPRQLAGNSVLQKLEAGHLQLGLETNSEHLNTARFCERVQVAVSTWLGEEIKLTIELVDSELETPARLDEQYRANEMTAARLSINQDPVVRQLIDKMDGSVDETSIQPLGEH